MRKLFKADNKKSRTIPYALFWCLNINFAQIPNTGYEDYCFEH